MDFSHQVDMPDVTLDRPTLMSKREARLNSAAAKIDLTGLKQSIPPTDIQTEITKHHQIDDTVSHSISKIRRRVRGQPTNIERSVFYKGAVYVVEEAIYSDSDNSSI